MTNAEVLRIAMEQHALDANCAPEDFLKTENVVVISRDHPNARRYLNPPFLCHFASYGSNIVASVDERVMLPVRQYVDEHPLERGFEYHHLHGLTKALEPYSGGGIRCYTGYYWLPDVTAPPPPPCAYPIRLLHPSDFAELYRPEWSNALVEKRPHLDKLAAGAYDGERLIGLAGCSADGDRMWQIGIDVLPDYRRQGVAAALTARLAAEIFARGKVPFYCCAWANVSSARNAFRSGFRPAWTEFTAVSL